MNTDTLIRVFDYSIDDNIVKSVNARELHQFLNVGRDFSNWIKSRISKYEFVENKDFVITAQLSEELCNKNDSNVYSPDPANIICIENDTKNSNAGRKPKEYIITLRMAKHLAMAENNIKGKEARDYFVQCEEELIKTRLNSGNSVDVSLDSSFDMISSLAASISQLSQAVKSQLYKLNFRQDDFENRLAEFECEASRLRCATNYFSITGFLRLHGAKHFTTDEKRTIGKKMTELSENRGYKIDRVGDAKYGYVNTYHEDLLLEVMETIYPAIFKEKFPITQKLDLIHN